MWSLGKLWQFSKWYAMHSPNNPPQVPDHFKLEMDVWKGISGGKWTELILLVWTAKRNGAGGKTGLSTVGAVRVLNSNCLLCQTRLLVMPRWINNGWLKGGEKKLIWEGNKCLTMKGGQAGGDLRLPEDLVCDRFWASEDFKFLSKLWLLRLLQPAHKCVKHHLDRQSSQTSRLIKSALLASVKLSSFCPCFVSLLVWALLFNNSCKSKLIGARSIWKLFAKWRTGRHRKKVFVHGMALLHYFIRPKVGGGRSE